MPLQSEEELDQLEAKLLTELAEISREVAARMVKSAELWDRLEAISRLRRQRRQN